MLGDKKESVSSVKSVRPLSLSFYFSQIAHVTDAGFLCLV